MEKKLTLRKNSSYFYVNALRNTSEFTRVSFFNHSVFYIIKHKTKYRRSNHLNSPSTVQTQRMITFLMSNTLLIKN